MKKLILLLIFALNACAGPVDEPENLIPRSKMSELVAELALNDQLSFLNSNGNMETQTIYTLKKFGINSRQFTDSYKYYLSKPGALESIYDDAQQIIIDKDPKAEDYIKNKLKGTPQDPALNR